MSSLLPTLRNVFRNNMRTSTNILYHPQTFTSFHRSLPISRPYSKNNRPSSTNDPSKVPIENPSTINNPVTPNPRDPLTGDTPAAPGSILAEYTSPQGSQLESSTSGSGSGGPPKKEEYISSTDRKRERIARFVTWGFFLGLLGGSIYLGRPIEREEEERMGWGTVYTPYFMRIIVVTSRTLTIGILDTIPETWKIYACCNFD